MILRRLEKIEIFIKAKNPPIVHTITMQKLKGETQEQAIERYRIENKIDSFENNEVFLFVLT